MNVILGFLGGLIGKLISTVGLWFTLYRAGQKSVVAEQREAEAKHIKKRIKAEQETPHEAADLADDIRSDPRGF